MPFAKRQRSMTSNPYKTWNSEDHANVFDRQRFVPAFLLKRIYEHLNDVQLLKEAARETGPEFSLLEVGCATGEFYHYLSDRYPKVSYTGCDISSPAIERAQAKFPKGANFYVVNEELAPIAEKQADIVVCRDVVHHQINPFAFLRRLYDMSTKYLVLRMRTRDSGESVLDPELSCQYLYGSWVPFLILNCDDVISELKRMEPQPTRIKLVKDYTILGGTNSRFLPKSCYERATGTAVTAVLVEKKGAGGTEPRIEAEAKNEPSNRSKLLGKITDRSLRRLLGRDYAGRTWW